MLLCCPPGLWLLWDGELALGAWEVGWMYGSIVEAASETGQAWDNDMVSLQWRLFCVTRGGGCRCFKDLSKTLLSILWWGHLWGVEWCGLLPEKPATERGGLANVCLWLTKGVDTVSAFINIKIAPSQHIPSSSVLIRFPFCSKQLTVREQTA